MDNLRQLRALQVLAACGNMGIAAEKLGVTKSALSQTIKRVEDIYDVPLFERDRQGVRPTVYGEILVDAATKGIRLFEEVQREFALMRNLETGRLLIGSHPATTEALLAPAVSKIAEQFPKLQFEVKEGSWPDVQEDLLEKRLDVYVGLEPDHLSADIKVEKFFMPPIRLFCRPGHPLDCGGPVSLAEGYNFPVIGTHMPDWAFERVRSAITEGGVEVDDIRDLFLFADNFGLIREVVRQSDALSATFPTNLEAQVEAGELVMLPLSESAIDAPLPTVVATLAHRLLPPAAAQVRETVKKVADGLMTNWEEQTAAPKGNKA